MHIWNNYPMSPVKWVKNRMFWNSLPLWSLCSSGGITQQVSNAPSQPPSLVVWVSVRVAHSYNKIARRHRRRPTLQHLVSLAANGPLESPAAEATSLSKLKVLLAKYNLITYTHCHYNLTRKNIHSIWDTKSRAGRSLYGKHITQPHGIVDVQ